MNWQGFIAAEELENVQILLVEDEVKISDAVANIMTQKGIQVDVADDGDVGLILADRNNYDVIILDIMLPGVSGLDILTHLRLKEDYTTVLLLTASEAVHNRVNSLNTRVDDYMVKPFAMSELSARIGVLAQRLQTTDISNKLEIGNVGLFVDKLLMEVDGEEVKLTFKETQVMQMFMCNPGIVFSKEQIMKCVWGNEKFVVENNVEIHVHNLRKKLGDRSTVRIETIRGVGYTLEVIKQNI